MTLEQLRLKHPRFIYKHYTTEKTNTGIVITYEFLLEPDIVFRPTVDIPLPSAVDPAAIELFAFHLGLVESISYWKAACPKEIIIEAGSLNTDQLRFWNDLYIHGLGEFFYRNRIDFTVPEFLKIKSTGDKPASAEAPAGKGNWGWKQEGTDLVLIGGGKDTAVTFGMLQNGSRRIRPMAVNPSAATYRILQAAGFRDPIIVRRTIDPILLQLNANGYLNGHTPFSAYLAFLGVCVGVLYKTEHVVVSNEKSANEGNVVYKGIEINHQYSKSFRFEQMIRSYLAHYFPSAPSYFSMLRPLNNLQIARMFALTQAFDAAFNSCNVGSKTDTWCRSCAKCAFTYLSLFPFLPYERMIKIFGTDLFSDPAVIEQVRKLTGLLEMKPFECVGTRDESVLAVYLAVDAYKKYLKEIPEGLLKIKSDLGISESEILQLSHALLDTWGDTYNLPPEHVTLVRAFWQKTATNI